MRWKQRQACILDFPYDRCSARTLFHEVNGEIGDPCPPLSCHVCFMSYRQFENYDLTNTISTIALCLIIFSGGIESKIKDIKPHLKRGILLSSVGIILTTAIVGSFVHFILGITFLKSLLLGAILSGTLLEK